MDSKELAKLIVETLADRHITNIITIDVTNKTAVTNYYVVGTARNATVAKTASEYLQDKLEGENKDGIFASGKEGERDGRWIVLDYGLVIVHIFHTDLRDFYDFEKLWAEPDGSNVERFMTV